MDTLSYAVIALFALPVALLVALVVVSLVLPHQDEDAGG